VQHLDIKKPFWPTLLQKRKSNGTEEKQVTTIKVGPIGGSSLFFKVSPSLRRTKRSKRRRGHFASKATELWTTLQRPRCAKRRCPQFWSTPCPGPLGHGLWNAMESSTRALHVLRMNRTWIHYFEQPELTLLQALVFTLSPDICLSLSTYMQTIC